jgi:hypothetical protein
VADGKARRKGRGDAGAPEEGDLGLGGFSLVLPLSLLAAGLVAYPALSAVADGTGDVMRAAVTFLIAATVATIGFGIVALLFNSFLAAHAAKEAADRPEELRGAGARRPAGAGDGAEATALPTLAIEEMGHQHAEIGDALAATESLLHHENNTP